MIQLNNKYLLSSNHLVNTKNGWKYVSDIKINDNIIGYLGDVKITRIIECLPRPNAPIIGEC
jgi:hypothetical protein